MYHITLISACSQNRVIGNNNQLLWHLPKDFAWFKEHTLHKKVVMGSNTMRNITQYTKGKPLPSRNNIVLSQHLRSIDIDSGFTLCRDYQDILDLSTQEEVMIIGGSQIYSLFMPYCSKIILTEIQHEFSGDSLFPEFNKEKFKVTFKESHIENSLNYDFVIYEKF